MKIDRDFISEWHPRYDQIAGDEGEYRDLVATVRKELTEEATLSKETFIRILDWKAARVKGIVRLEEFCVYQEAVGKAFVADENDKLEILVQEWGIGAPVGSTILHFMYPDSFPIIDVRTAQTLHHAGLINSKSTDLSHYPSFRAKMLTIAKENPQFTLREIDRAVFAYHKISLSHKTGQHIRMKEPELNRARGARVGLLKIKDKVSNVFKDRVGGTFLREEIVDLVVAAYPGTNRSSVIPSDYCYNIINAGIKFDFHVFEYLGDAQYMCLGIDHPYSGPICWNGEEVGKWTEGKYELWKGPRK
jgi:hypothetical protein